MTDRMKGDDHQDLYIAVEGSFREVCNLHERLLGECVELHEKAADRTRLNQGLLHVEAMHLSRKCDALKAMLRFRFPEASDEFFGEERN